MLLGACAQEEIVFDHEQPAFETKDGMILLEVIVPSSTKADDVIYISGPFNGGDEVAAEDVRWHLEKSTTIDKKWGIYLDPSSFVNGKTLADGYRFVSVREGEERTAKNEAVNRTEVFAAGTRTSIYVSYWNMFFYVAPEIDHDGPVLYVDNKTLPSMLGATQRHSADGLECSLQARSPSTAQTGHTSTSARPTEA